MPPSHSSSSANPLLIFDGHLDLALNALDYRRDLSLDLSTLRTRHSPATIQKIGTPALTFSSLAAANVRLALASILARFRPNTPPGPPSLTAADHDWPTPDTAFAAAFAQLAWYRRMHQRRLLRIITTADQLIDHWHRPAPQPLGVILTLEGADPVLQPEQLPYWRSLGLRTLMLAHLGPARYAHGTPTPASPPPDLPLPPHTRLLLRLMHKFHMPLDLSHLSDSAFFQALDLFPGRIYSSHSACRHLLDHPRNHTDQQLRLIIQRHGVIGLPLYTPFLATPHQPRPSLHRWIDHLDHICQLAGSPHHVALGSDLDGGFGTEFLPAEINSAADLPRLADLLLQRNYSPSDIRLFLGENWFRFWSAALPAARRRPRYKFSPTSKTPPSPTTPPPASSSPPAES